MAYLILLDTIIFPVTPGKIVMTINNRNETIDLINEGEVNLIKSPGLTDITIDELLLPGAYHYPFENRVLEGDDTARKKRAKYFLNKLEGWKKKKNPIKFIILRRTPDNKKVMPQTSMKVTIEDYEITEDAQDYGMDFAVKLQLKQYRHFSAKKLKPKKTGSRDDTRIIPKTYKVKKGDSLAGIAKKILGDATLKKEIYKLNKKKMDEVAKKHGHKSAKEGQTYWIYKGEVLKMPGANIYSNFRG